VGVGEANGLDKREGGHQTGRFLEKVGAEKGGGVNARRRVVPGYLREAWLSGERKDPHPSAKRTDAPELYLEKLSF